MHIIHSPLYVIIPMVRVKDKKFILNLNNYRVTNRFTLNKAKVIYTALMRERIMALPTFNVVEAVFINYAATANIPDTNNVIAIHEKFFGDAFVKYGKLEDDHPDFWFRSTSYFGGIDRKNPRVTICLREAKVKPIPNI